MLNKVAFFTVAVLATLQAVAAFNVVVPAQERRCFFENLDVKDNLHISYQVGEGGHLDIDFMASATLQHVPKNEHKEWAYNNHGLTTIHLSFLLYFGKR